MKKPKPVETAEAAPLDLSEAQDCHNARNRMAEYIAQVLATQPDGSSLIVVDVLGLEISRMPHGKVRILSHIDFEDGVMRDAMELAEMAGALEGASRFILMHGEGTATLWEGEESSEDRPF